MSPETRHNPSETLETLSPIALGGRIIDLNSMLVGLQVMAHERYGDFTFMQFSDSDSVTRSVQPNPIHFSDLWCSLVESAAEPSRQWVALIKVHAWLGDERIEKTPYEKASSRMFLETANSFDWEHDPELLAEMKRTMMHIGDAHAELRTRAL